MLKSGTLLLLSAMALVGCRDRVVPAQEQYARGYYEATSNVKVNSMPPYHQGLLDGYTHGLEQQAQEDLIKNILKGTAPVPSGI